MGGARAAPSTIQHIPSFLFLAYFLDGVQYNSSAFSSFLPIIQKIVAAHNGNVWYRISPCPISYCMHSVSSWLAGGSAKMAEKRQRDNDRAILYVNESAQNNGPITVAHRARSRFKLRRATKSEGTSLSSSTISHEKYTIVQLSVKKNMIGMQLTAAIPLRARVSPM